MSDNLIVLKNINKIYNKGKTDECYALKDLSLNIDKGEFLAIIGKSGVGKSTLLHILAQVETYTSGTYLYENDDVKTFKDSRASEIRNKEIGLVLQSYALADSYTVYDNVVLPLLFGKHINRKTRNEMVFNALKKVGIENLAKNKSNKISGGQRQRVAIARALINNPKIILLDEPTGALDSETANELMETLEELNSSGITIIMVTHDNSLAKRAKRIIEISDGRIIYDSQN